jgi:hypothetical protein
VIEAESGAMLGTDIQAVTDAIENCDDIDFMKKQVQDAIELRKQVDFVETEKFWSMFCE